MYKNVITSNTTAANPAGYTWLWFSAEGGEVDGSNGPSTPAPHPAPPPAPSPAPAPTPAPSPSPTPAPTSGE